MADVLIYGAGAVGQYLGARLAVGGHRVHLVGRRPLVEAVCSGKTAVAEFDSAFVPVPSRCISASETLADAPTPALTLLTVKGGATTAAAADLQNHLPVDAPIISFQNGVANVQRIRTAAPGLVAIAGMVPYNVVLGAPGRPRRTSAGELAAAANNTTRRWQTRFSAAGLPVRLFDDLEPVQWGKLLINLNNPINALSGRPLREQLLDPGFRRVVADMQTEGLAVLRQAGIKPAKAAPLAPAWVPRILRLPTPVFRFVASRMLKIDPSASSSMQDDRRANRPTEVRDLCGAIVSLAVQRGMTAPVNRAVMELVESAPDGQFFSSTELTARLQTALQGR